MSSEAAPENKGEEEAKPKKKLNLAELVVVLPPLLNTVIILITFGFLTYYKLMFKRPEIVEKEERKRLTELSVKIKEEEAKVVYVSLDPITVNIASAPVEGGTQSSTELRRLHYVNLGVAFETRGNTNKDIIEALKPYILDKIIFIVGKKTYDQLSTIQGRYVLQLQIQEAVNQIALAKVNPPPQEPPVFHTFFNQLIVQ